MRTFWLRMNGIPESGYDDRPPVGVESLPIFEANPASGLHGTPRISSKTAEIPDSSSAFATANASRRSPRAASIFAASSSMRHDSPLLVERGERDRRCKELVFFQANAVGCGT